MAWTAVQRCWCARQQVGRAAERDIGTPGGYIGTRSEVFCASTAKRAVVLVRKGAGGAWQAGRCLR